MSKSFVKKKKSLKVMLVIDSFKIKLLKLHISFLESIIIIIIMKEKKKHYHLHCSYLTATL